MKAARHRFSSEIHGALRACYRVDDWHGVLEVLEDWLVIAAAIGVSLWAWEHLPLAPAALIYVLALFVISSRHRSLYDLLHQASHRTLARHRGLNFVLGTLASGYLVFQSLTAYRLNHVVDHHPFLADPERDPDYKALRDAGAYGGAASPAGIRRFLARMFLPSALVGNVRGLVRNKLLNPREARWERGFRLAYTALVIGLLVAAGWGPHFVAYWLVPMVTTTCWVSSVLELMEHYPFIEQREHKDLLLARNRDYHPLLNLLVGVHWEGYHLVHHLFPAVPSWRLREAHRILMKDEAYATVRHNMSLRETLAEMMVLRG
jgi:fatty acid desaturase